MDTTNNSFLKIKLIRLWLLISFGLIFLLSCSSNNISTLKNYYAPTAKLVLHQDLTIPAFSTGVYIQNGRVVTDSERDQYHANCRLIVYDLKEVTQIVKADQFDITRLRYDEDYVSRATPQYASTGSIIYSSGPSPEDYATQFFLSSTKQPNVTQLVCAHWEDPTMANHLTPAQIRTTLGDIITLK